MKTVTRLELTSLLGFCRPIAYDELRTSRNNHSSQANGSRAPVDWSTSCVLIRYTARSPWV